MSKPLKNFSMSMIVAMITTTLLVLSFSLAEAEDPAPTPPLCNDGKDFSLSVKSLGDEPDANPGDCACATAKGECTLRAAIDEANVRFVGTKISIEPEGTISLSDQLTIKGNMTISGPAKPGNVHLVTLQAAGSHRIFEIRGPGNCKTCFWQFEVPMTVGIGQLVLKGGDVSFPDKGETSDFEQYWEDTSGGAILVWNRLSNVFLRYVDITENKARYGGGISNNGYLNVSQSNIYTNNARFGGGIDNNSNSLLHLHSSSIQDNTAEYNGGGLSFGDDPKSAFSERYKNGWKDRVNTVIGSSIVGNKTTHHTSSGGGIFAAGAQVVLVNSTVSDNSAHAQAGIETYYSPSNTPDQLLQIQNTTIRLFNTTVAKNNSDTACAGLCNGTGNVFLKNSVVANNSSGQQPADCAGYLTSEGNNLLGNDKNCTILGDKTGNITNQDPLLGPLTTETGTLWPAILSVHPLQEGSPAIDTGNANGCVDNIGKPIYLDQVFHHRPLSPTVTGTPRCDIGAVEFASPKDNVDQDGDGTSPATGDCNDADKEVNPKAVEVCDGIDNNCNGETDDANTYYMDEDGDGYGNFLKPVKSCTPPAGAVTDDSDCDDINGQSHPGGTEVCDGSDNNCNGKVDEGFNASHNYFVDTDHDGQGDPKSVVSLCDPYPPEGFSDNNKDCDDTDPTIHQSVSAFVPDPCDGKDNNCNGYIDDDPSFFKTFYRDYDQDGFGFNDIRKACFPGEGYTADNTLDCQDYDKNIHPGATELCNGKDDNCDEKSDEAFPNLGTSCDTGLQGICGTGKMICANESETTCQKQVTPGSVAETCDNLDNDCDGQTDEDASGQQTWYKDADGDGKGDPKNKIASCAKPAGYVENGDDCNDNSAAVYPNAEEICDGLDNDCNGQIDEEVSTAYYQDLDKDGFGNTTVAKNACSQPAGFVTQKGDCDDSNAGINPLASEVCNGKDDNCNGQGDENIAGVGQACDSGLSGVCKVGVKTCAGKSGVVCQSSIVPGTQKEVCDNLDNDCDGLTDDGDPDVNGQSSWHPDNDKDGHGDAAPEKTAKKCTAPQGYVATSDDCNDTKASIYPGAEEICNGVDDDCNGQIDEGTGGTACDTGMPDFCAKGTSQCQTGLSQCVPDASNQTEICDKIDDDCDTKIDDQDNNVVGQMTWYPDTDQDGYGSNDPAANIQSCNKPQGSFVSNNDDCNDKSATVYPNAEEICGNNIDDDCNGVIDDC